MEKTSPLFEFSWSVHLAGHECLTLLPLLSRVRSSTGKSADPPVRCLVRRTGERGERLTHPLKATECLFRDFADLQIDENIIEGEVVNFANQFGMLGEPVTKGFESLPSPGFGIHVLSAESLESWRQEVLEMKGLLELADAATKKPTPDLELLRKRVKWRRDWIPEEDRAKEGRDYRSVASVHLRPEPDATDMVVPSSWERIIPDGDLAYPALHVIQAKINEKLDALHVVPRLAWNSECTRLRTQIYPPSLLAALWVQVFKMIDSGAEYTRCAGCNETRRYGNEPGQFRADQTTCGSTCRKRVNRKRKADAMQLWRDGRSVEEIALRTGSKEATIQRWLKKTL